MRRLHAVRFFSLAFVFTSQVLFTACERNSTAVETGRLSLNVQSNVSTAAVDAWRVGISGPGGSQSKSGSPGSTIEFTQLVPGSYAVQVEGLEGGELATTGGTSVNVVAGSNATASVSLTDVPPRLTVAATDASASELGPDQGTFTISRQGSSSAALQIALAWSGTATATIGVTGQDYRAIATTLNVSASTLTMPAGQRSATITIEPFLDVTPENTETVTLTLVSSSGYTLQGSSSATVNIADAPVVTVTATDPNASEVGPDPGQWRISRTGDLSAALVVPFAISGTATSADYGPLPTSVTIAAGATSANVLLSPIADALSENDETVILTISANPSAYTVGSPNSATITIADTPAAVARMVVRTHPTSNVESGVPFAQQPVVELQDAQGNVVTNSSLAITVQRVTGTGVLRQGTNTVNSITVNAVNGVATFTGLNIGGSGAHVLRFTANGLSFADANAVSATQVIRSLAVVSVQDTVPALIGFSMQLEIQDAAGLRITPNTNFVRVAQVSGDGALAGATSVTANNGLVNFQNLTLSRPGRATLRATVDQTSATVDVQIPVRYAWKSISAGGSHTCGLMTTGEVYCWGANYAGQLGTGGNGSQLPLWVGADYAEVATGGDHTCGRRTSGLVYCWGRGTEGQLGTGLNISSPQAVPVQATAFSSIVVGISSSCGLTSANALYCWGDNRSGQLGIGSLISSPIPVRVQTSANINTAGRPAGHMCALTIAATIQCWGNGSQGQLGDGVTQQVRTLPVSINSAFSFSQVEASGNSHSCALRTNREVYCWGDNEFGELGIGTTSTNYFLSPQRVSTTVPMASITVGSNHSCSIEFSTGSAYCWGLNSSGALGEGTVTLSPLPKAVSGGQRFTQLSAGVFHTCGVTALGRAYCWGYNGTGTLGNNSNTNSSIPVEVRTPDATGVASLGDSSQGVTVKASKNSPALTPSLRRRP